MKDPPRRATKKSRPRRFLKNKSIKYIYKVVVEIFRLTHGNFPFNSWKFSTSKIDFFVGNFPFAWWKISTSKIRNTVIEQ